MTGNIQLQNYNKSKFFGMCKVTFGWILLTCTSVRAFLDGYMVGRNIDWRIHNGFGNLVHCKIGHHHKMGTESNENDTDGDRLSGIPQQQRSPRIRERVKDLARKMVAVPINVASSITPMPQAVASVLKDATLNAVDLAVEEGMLLQIFIPHPGT
jgi:hypothetical protein